MIEVVAAVIIYQKKILAFRRGASKFDYVSFKYEFPGGKVEADESLELALQRELQEELNLYGTVEELIATIEHSYPDFTIKMHCFLVKIDDFNGVLKEHTEFAHVPLNEAHQLDWIEADRPILEILRKKYLNVFS
jgi:8-oxo-dGTP diphosphatase